MLATSVAAIGIGIGPLVSMTKARPGATSHENAGPCQLFAERLESPAYGVQLVVTPMAGTHGGSTGNVGTVSGGGV